MDNVLQYVNQMNRPLNATNVGDALGSQGVKKGLAQKYLETLAEKGKLCVKEAGKQKVYYPTQEEEALDADALAAVHAQTRDVNEELGALNTEIVKLQTTLRSLKSVQSVDEMKKELKAFSASNAALRARLEPLRDSEAKGDVITEVERVKIEDAFMKVMEVWLDRRRKFNNLFDCVLEGTGEPKKKLWGSLGFESESDAGIDYEKFRKIYDDLKKQRLATAFAKRRKQL